MRVERTAGGSDVVCCEVIPWDEGLSHRINVNTQLNIRRLQ